MNNPATSRSALSDRKLADHDFSRDIAAVRDNTMVPTMLETVCLATGLRFAAIARVNEQRWITCSTIDYLDFGLEPGDELEVESTLCHEVRHQTSEIVINDVQCDEVYRDHHTPQIYGFRSYLSIPVLRPDGTFFGTLCALDPEPNRLDDPRILKMVRLFAKLVGDSLEVSERLQEVQEELVSERHLAEVQEQFMAILAHDLRNPVAAMLAGLRMLARSADPEQKKTITLLDATARRMGDLVNNLMDHARNRLGDGIVLDRVPTADLGGTLDLIISEFRAVAPSHEIIADINVPQPVDCDRARVAQLLSNLLGNAITHGAQDRPIRVSACVADDSFTLQVANKGEAISEDRLASLFLPFKKGSDTSRREGLGLGLYIAAEIAKAHGGKVTVVSDQEKTVFTFKMPC
ncbi:GAF domain-containing sensor histidine kinase [Paracoccus rhizosphaerae]|uniref:histidine kinase n=1 Tax=Paracoccus rhizosphaerae TaxID=1133347 RepID=A0ABV6CIB2_9RHOB|nr:GAF domain-containing sensor histidine kinase [Paracoccus rhizosphaerae]